MKKSTFGYMGAGICVNVASIPYATWQNLYWESGMATWKDVERNVAKKLGGRRNLESHGPDVVCDWLIVEVKHRKKIPEWIKSALKQATDNTGYDKLGIVVLHEKYKRDSLVLMSFNDFCDWFGK